MVSRKRFAAILASASLVVMVIALSVYFTDLRRPYIIEVDGEILTHSGNPGTVSEVLDEADISAKPTDLIHPPLEVKIEPGSIISIKRPSKVILIRDGFESLHWTHQNKLAQFLAETDISWSPTTRIYVDNRLIPHDSIPDQDLSLEIRLDNQSSIDVVDGPDRLSLTTYANTVGAALWDKGIKISSSDNIFPPVGSWLLPEQEIIIDRANTYWIEVDLERIQVLTRYTKVNDVLSDAGVLLSGSDYSLPAADVELTTGSTINIFRVYQEYIVRDEPIPFDSSLVPAQDLDIDHRIQLSIGIPGTHRKLTRITMENNVPTDESLVGEWILRPPVNESIGYGTNIVIRSMDTPDGAIEYWRVVSMRATAYTAATAGKPPSHPAYGITASGVPAGTGWSRLIQPLSRFVATCTFQDTEWHLPVTQAVL